MAACGLIAHADGVVEAGEWERVLWMLGERLGSEDAGLWKVRLADREKLSAFLNGLLPPPPFFAEPILEKAWRMALADGEGSDAEVAVHDDLARRLGMDGAHVARLRLVWLAQAQRRSELVADFATNVAHLDGQLDPEEAAQLDALIERLPLSESQRGRLTARRNAPPSLDEMVGALLRMDAEERGIALLALVPLVKASADGERERALFCEVASRLAISEDDVAQMLAD